MSFFFPLQASSSLAHLHGSTFLPDLLPSAVEVLESWVTLELIHSCWWLESFSLEEIRSNHHVQHWSVLKCLSHTFFEGKKTGNASNSLFPSLVALSRESFFLKSNMNIPWCSLRPLEEFPAQEGTPEMFLRGGRAGSPRGCVCPGPWLCSWCCPRAQN